MYMHACMQYDVALLHILFRSRQQQQLWIRRRRRCFLFIISLSLKAKNEKHHKIFAYVETCSVCCPCCYCYVLLTIKKKKEKKRVSRENSIISCGMFIQSHVILLKCECVQGDG